MVNVHSAVASRINRRKRTPPIFSNGLASESNTSPLAIPSYRWDLDKAAASSGRSSGSSSSSSSRSSSLVSAPGGTFSSASSPRASQVSVPSRNSSSKVSTSRTPAQTTWSTEETTKVSKQHRRKKSSSRFLEAPVIDCLESPYLVC